ncbi:MAG: fatty acid desaturase [Cyanobacteriota bacterium]|nr:fatty acid desaturase [Cyanobacteriota bacterium]
MTWTTRRGLFLAAGLILAWLGSWLLLLPTSFSNLPPEVICLAILARTMLQTGLFIVAHDAMHGTLWPTRPAVNRRIGQLALWFYAALPYGPCLDNHRLHHRHSGTPQDPDHHGEGAATVVGWFQRFMAAYLSPSQLTALVISWLVLAGLAASMSTSPLANVVLYGALPLLLSSLQLFLVGTYLPHRPVGPILPEAGACPEPRSLDWPAWLSLLACFHFGYHWEHHAFPHLAWHELPEARRRVKAGFGSDGSFALPLSGR